MRDGFAKAAQSRLGKQGMSLPFENPTGCLTKTDGEAVPAPFLYDRFASLRPRRLLPQS